MSRRGPGALGLAGALVATLALLPLAYLLVRALGADADAWRTVLRPRTLSLVASTVALVGAVSLAATALGVALAWLVVRTDLPFRRVVAVAAALPLVIPSYVVALALIAAFGPGGLLGQGTWIFGFPGAWAALTLATYPYVYLLVAAALRRMDPALEDAARGLGRSRGQVFRQVTLPVLRPAVGAGGVLVALYSLSDFGVVSLMRFDALTRAIFQQYRSLFDRTPRRCSASCSWCSPGWCWCSRRGAGAGAAWCAPPPAPRDRRPPRRWAAGGRPRRRSRAGCCSWRSCCR